MFFFFGVFGFHLQEMNEAREEHLQRELQRGLDDLKKKETESKESLGKLTMEHAEKIEVCGEWTFIILHL